MKIPVDIALHKKSRELELVYEDGPVRLSFEYLRVLSPSAEVQGHSPDEAVLQVGKRLVDITGVQVVGNYAIQFTFSDGHDSGIYSLSLIHISEPTRRTPISYAVFCLKKKKNTKKTTKKKKKQ